MRASSIVSPTEEVLRFLNESNTMEIQEFRSHREQKLPQFLNDRAEYSSGYKSIANNETAYSDVSDLQSPINAYINSYD